MSRDRPSFAPPAASAWALVLVLLALGLSLGCRSTSPLAERAGTGDVAFRLSWEGTSDLDLHVRDSAGEHIFFGHRRSGSGGHLDVDCNSGTGKMCQRPIENVFWPPGTAPAGEFLFWIQAHAVVPAEAPVRFGLKVLEGERVVIHVGGTLAQNGDRFGPYAVRYPPEQRREWKLRPVESTGVEEGRSLPFTCDDGFRFTIRFGAEEAILIYDGRTADLLRIGDELVADGGRTVLRMGPTLADDSVLATPEGTHRGCRPEIE